MEMAFDYFIQALSLKKMFAVLQIALLTPLPGYLGVM
jgi:hypothetical protein